MPCFWRITGLTLLTRFFQARLENVADLRLKNRLDAEHRVTQGAAGAAPHLPPNPAPAMHPPVEPVEDVEEQDAENEDLKADHHLMHFTPD